MLSTETQTAWTDYLAAEKEGARTLFLPRLERFIEAVLGEPYEVGREWVFELAADLSDRGVETPIRFPLFDQVLVPLLADGVLAEEPGCARWLAWFLQSFPGSKSLDLLPENLRSPVALLIEALQLDPDDGIARRRLVEHYARYMNYTLHEIPSGVLYGNNGASRNECSELLALLGEFKAHVERLGEMERYADLIAACELHYNAWLAYYQSGSAGGSYAEFLKNNCYEWQ